MRCTPSARLAHFAAHHFRLKCAGDFSCFLSFMSLFRCFFASLHAMHTFFPMTYIYVRDIYIFIYKTYKMVCMACSTPKSPDKSRFKLHTMAKNGVQDSVHGVQGSVHERRNARIGMACQAHAAPLLYVHPHPTAARRAATLASSEREMHKGARISLRPLQRRFKARKKPEGYTSTPTGLKRLKMGLQRLRTQNTAFHVNENGKGTPSGVPQPIHKRKLILVKEEFDASSSGGGAENRTPVHESPLIGISKLSRWFSLGRFARSDTLAASQPVRS